MTLSLEQVRHVAALARLSLTPEEEQRYQQQLSAILEAMEQLAAVDTHGVEPTSHASTASSRAEVPQREDGLVPSLPLEKALQNAPSKVGTGFSVPRILE